MKCVVGEWLDSLTAERQADFDNALDTLSRVALHNKIVEDEKGVRPFGLTALKDHLNTKCVCGRVVAQKSVTVSSDPQKGTYNVQDFKPLTPEGMLEACGLSADEYVVAGEVGCRSRTLQSGDVVYAYSFKARPRTDLVDVEWLAERARNAPPVEAVYGAGDDLPWLVFQAGDTQISKISELGSTPEILERYFESVEAVAHELIRRHGQFGGLQIVMPGDICEGSASQSGRNIAWLTREHVTTQTRIMRRMMMTTLERLAPLAPRVYLDVVNGNHDDSDRRHNSIPGDGWATEAAIAVSDAIELNPDAFNHVEVRIPNEWWGYMTVPVGNSTVTVVHGHQFGRLEKAFDWWKGQTFGDHHPKDSSVLQHGHYHTMSIMREGNRTRVCSPTYDMGSDYYREKTGAAACRGGLMYLLHNNEVSNLTLV